MTYTQLHRGSAATLSSRSPIHCILWYSLLAAACALTLPSVAQADPSSHATSTCTWTVNVVEGEGKHTSLTPCWTPDVCGGGQLLLSQTGPRLPGFRLLSTREPSVEYAPRLAEPHTSKIYKVSQRLRITCVSDKAFCREVVVCYNVKVGPTHRPMWKSWWLPAGVPDSFSGKLNTCEESRSALNHRHFATPVEATAQDAQGDEVGQESCGACVGVSARHSAVAVYQVVPQAEIQRPGKGSRTSKKRASQLFAPSVLSYTSLVPPNATQNVQHEGKSGTFVTISSTTATVLYVILSTVLVTVLLCGFLMEIYFKRAIYAAKTASEESEPVVECVE
ncbi:hypothetical protein ERJ75_000947800 [Trypanosoma vivax]|uniref:Uncharacterized protein n=1 Tax=Trypanosoma vivax (strain Y486) TaxID=1055687 RepID=G0U4I2_TRYVY|nr:hypothetical protein TRVL_00610 [Trypanosoma vivax]KAH8611783.1 hypothetical protein ERJ75_000947800 [Trypanosoma vivax]CCC52346.1 conserved hypothetical protein [Trypanosoma vivax Y486]